MSAAQTGSDNPLIFGAVVGGVGAAGYCGQEPFIREAPLPLRIIFTAGISFVGSGITGLIACSPIATLFCGVTTASYLASAAYHDGKNTFTYSLIRYHAEKALLIAQWATAISVGL